MSYQTCLPATLCMLLATRAGGLPADEPDAKAKSASDAVIEGFRQDAAHYEMSLATRPARKLTLKSDPLLRWGNPARTGEDGAVFLWLDGERPAVVGSVFTYRLGEKVHRKHELMSLATVPLTAEWKGQPAWTPDRGGIEWAPLPGARAPADASRRRTTQLRHFARRFRAHISELDGDEAELRLMPQPVYQYRAPAQGVLDGAIFSFALGTDPEVLLLIEARETTKGREWQYAFARFHFASLQASLGDEIVWRAEPDQSLTRGDIGQPEHQKKTYVSYHIRDAAAN